MFYSRFILTVLLAFFLLNGCRPPVKERIVEPHPVTKLGLREAALYVIQKIPEEEFRNQLLVKITSHLAEKREYDLALKTTGLITDLNYNSTALEKVALCKVKDLELGEALKIAHTIPSEYHSSRVIAAVAVAYEDAEQYRKGRELAETISEPNSQARAFADIAQIYSREGYRDLSARIFARAIRAAERERSIIHRIETLTYIANRYKEAGFSDQSNALFRDVFDLAEQIHLEQYRVEAWVRVFSLYEKSSFGGIAIQKALSVADNLTESDPYLKDELTANILRALLEDNNIERANTVVEKINDQSLKSIAMAEIGVHQVFDGSTMEGLNSLKKAVKTARQIENNTVKNRTLSAISEFYVRVEGIEEALHLKTEVTDPHGQSKILIMLADHHAVRENTEKSREAMSKALSNILNVHLNHSTADLLVDLAVIKERFGIYFSDVEENMLSRILWKVDERWE